MFTHKLESACLCVCSL